MASGPFSSPLACQSASQPCLSQQSFSNSLLGAGASSKVDDVSVRSLFGKCPAYSQGGMVVT